MKTSSPGVQRLGLIWLALAYVFSNIPAALGAAADLWQARNGTALAPTSPVDWVKGNAGSANSHYAEGHSIPYRTVLTGVSAGYHKLVIEWDSKQNGRHAIDYISHYNRLHPHTHFGDHILPEMVDPLIGLPDTLGPPGSFPIPTPSGAGSPVTNQPAASFASLPASERVITIWNGTITNVTYLSEADLSAESASSQLAIEFIATNATVVIAWGGHIATRLDWGESRSAAGINGSPYHMRLISLDGSGGNQDRSLQAQAVVIPPTCGIEGPVSVCPGTTNVYFASTDAVIPVYSWSLANNAAGAIIVGSTNGPSVTVVASSGSYTVQVRVDGEVAQANCGTDVTVLAPTTATPVADQLACPGTTVTFGTTPAGAGPFAFAWRRNGELLNGATNEILTLEEVTLADEGFYCVEVTGACSAVTNCAALTVVPPPVITCPPNITVECFADVPPPNAGAVFAASDFVAVSVMHVGDVAVTNGCEITIARRYQATDACGSSSFCDQTIRVRDTLAPVIVCAPDRVVECGAEWDFDSPSASDMCTANVPVTIIGTVTNQLAGSLFSATRTWQAMDACSNAATCSQTITLQDTTPPEVICPGDITVVGSGPPGAAVDFAVTATDVCDTNPTVLCVPASGTIFPLGISIVRCEAVDFSSNRSTCSFTVTVQDTEPPRIICPADMVVAEDSPGAGHVAAYPAPAVSDNFDANPVITCTPPSGATLPVGDNVVNCTARDASGNTAACSFIIRVVPHTIVAASTADSGPGTLRQALMDANALGDANIIQFAFPGEPPHEIHLLSPLPAVTGPLTMDGWSQPGFTGSPIIEIHGIPSATGLMITAGNTTVRGLILNGFATGIHIERSGGNVIQGNFIGVDSTGITAVSNTADGIYVAAPNNLIGGTNSGVGNVIGGSVGSGVVLDTLNASANAIQGNLIGAGVGGAAIGNHQHGIALRNGAAGNIIGPGNLIVNNQGVGILLETSAGSGNAIRGNTIRSNAGLGIDVNGDGITDNDDGDTDNGPNDAQNYPVLSKAQTFLGGPTIITGTLDGSSNTLYQIDFFLNTVFGAGLGETFLGSATVDTGSNTIANFSIALPVGVPPDYFITSTATDPANNTSEFSLGVRVGSAPAILAQPVSTNVLIGTPAIFCVTAQGSAPLLYQWRRNGANIPDATNACYLISHPMLSDGGSYSVVVANPFDAILSDEALLTFDLPSVQAGDNFAERVALVGSNNIIAGHNFLATREAGEPNHAGKPGGRSVWYTWTAPGVGIARFRTTGSTFDTLLAVYEGPDVAHLDPVNNDEDRGGYFTSDVRFNAYPGLEYEIAIDGFGGEQGTFVLNWEFEGTGHLLPVIVTHPVSQTVAPGASCTLSVLAIAGCTDGHYDCRHPKKDDPIEHPEHNARLTYQWFRNGVSIPGATNAAFTIFNTHESDLGDYWVQITDRERSIESQVAIVQINATGAIAQNVQAMDKFLDAVTAAPLIIGELDIPAPSEPRDPDPNRPPVAATGTVVSGFTGTQVFNTGTNTTSRLENICGVIGGASAWLSIVPTTNGTLHVNTHNSSYDTVIAVFTRSPTNALMLQLVDCNNNDGTNLTSALNVPASVGVTNFVLIDGVGGARGTLKLTYSLVIPSTLIPLGVTEEGFSRFQIVGRPGMRCTIQRCTSLGNWSSILTITSETGVFEFTDTDATPSPGTFYRALMLP
jgi:hypothetical protein